MILENNLLRKQKRRKSSKNVKVDIYAYASELYEQLNSIGIIERVKSIPQLGVIRVEKRLEKTRFDYVFLQLYFHQLIKEKLQNRLEYTYNNSVNAKEFLNGFRYSDNQVKPTIGDLLQIFTLIYNAGHFYNTFAASRAAVMLASQNVDFQNMIILSSQDARYKSVAKKIIDDKNYNRFHLINSLLILERCDQDKDSVKIARELIYAYLNEDDLSEKSKLHNVFKIYRSVRNVSYVAYDLQIAKIPMTIELCNDTSVLVLFQELLSAYNDNAPSSRLVDSVSKMLDDTVYNENSNAICYYYISLRIMKKIISGYNLTTASYYCELWLNQDSVLNVKYTQKRDYSSDGILKLTFAEKDRQLSEKLFLELEKVNSSRVGYYDRANNKRTIVVSIKKKCGNKSKVAIKILNIVVKYIRRIAGIETCDSRYILSTKFFLYYYFSERNVVIKPTIDNKVCVMCCRGKNQRVESVQMLMRNGIGDADAQHEAEHLCYVLRQDAVNDTTITIPGSIVVYDKIRQGQTLCEFDGLILFPLRKDKQVIFMEAKNTRYAPNYGKKCLCEKLDKLKIIYDKNSVEIHDKDASLCLTV